jgi:hypothetical protein
MCWLSPTYRSGWGATARRPTRLLARGRDLTGMATAPLHLPPSSGRIPRLPARSATVRACSPGRSWAASVQQRADSGAPGTAELPAPATARDALGCLRFTYGDHAFKLAEIGCRTNPESLPVTGYREGI